MSNTLDGLSVVSHLYASELASFSYSAMHFRFSIVNISKEWNVHFSSSISLQTSSAAKKKKKAAHFLAEIINILWWPHSFFFLFALWPFMKLQGSMNNYFLIHKCMPNNYKYHMTLFHVENYKMVVHDEMIDTNTQHKCAKAEAAGRLSATSGLGRVRLCRRKKPSLHKHISHSARGWFHFHLTATFCHIQTTVKHFEDTRSVRISYCFSHS